MNVSAISQKKKKKKEGKEEPAACRFNLAYQFTSILSTQTVTIFVHLVPIVLLVDRRNLVLGNSSRSSTAACAIQINSSICYRQRRHTVGLRFIADSRRLSQRKNSRNRRNLVSGSRASLTNLIKRPAFCDYFVPRVIYGVTVTRAIHSSLLYFAPPNSRKSLLIGRIIIEVVDSRHCVSRTCTLIYARYAQRDSESLTKLKSSLFEYRPRIFSNWSQSRPTNRLLRYIVPATCGFSMFSELLRNFPLKKSCRKLTELQIPRDSSYSGHVW